MSRHMTSLALFLIFTTAAIAEEPIDLAGRWLLTMPAGFEYDATLESGVEPGLYRLRCGAVLLQGLYELRGRQLIMVQPVDPKLTGLIWHAKNRNALVLVEHPEKSQFGADYRNATMGRQTQAKAHPKSNR